MEKRARARGTRRVGRRIGERLTYANVMATIAVFGVLAGGGAYAASKIGPKDLAKNAVRSKHIKKNAIKTPKIADRAVTKGKLGEDIELPTALWANVVNSSGTPTLVRGSGATGVAAAGTAQVRVSFNRDIRECSYQATGWLNTETGVTTYANPPIVVVERGPSASVASNAVNVQTYTGTTGALDSGNYEFTVAVFC